MKRRVRLPVLQSDAIHRANEISKAASKQRRARAPRHSPEVQRDAAIPIAEMFPDRESYVRWRDAFALQGTGPDPVPTPRTRADCPPDRHERGCGAFRCRFHLWRIDEPAGRPGLRNVPRDPAGLTISQTGDMGPKAAPTITASWLRGGALSPSCALDEADRGPHGNIELAGVLQKHRTLVAHLVKRALRSLAAQGITAEQLEMLLPDYELKRTEPSRGSK